MLARHLHFDYLASGLLFRGLAYILVHQFNYNELELVNPKLSDIESAVNPSQFKYSYSDQIGEQLYWHRKDITLFLSNEKIGKYASIIGTNQLVRNELARLQHEYADAKDLVTDGRDAGSVIFPNADIKFFLTASLEIRAQRWQKNQKEIGRDISYEYALQEITERDERDANRLVAPLRIPDHAIIIDSSNLSKEQVLEKIVQEVLKKSGR